MSQQHRATILFFEHGRPGTLPASYALEADDAGAIVGGVEIGLASFISRRACDQVTHYALQEFSDRNAGDHVEATRSRRAADMWLDCHEEAEVALGHIYQARAN